MVKSSERILSTYYRDTSFGEIAEGKAGAMSVFLSLGMLVSQAAESFALWHGIRPGTGQVLRELRRQLAR